MIEIHSGEITRNFQIFKPHFSKGNSHKFKALYDNKDFFLQVPKSSVFLVNQPFKNLYTMTIRFSNISSNSQVSDFVKQISYIDRNLNNNSKKLWDTIDDDQSSKQWTNSINFNKDKSCAYMTLNINKNLVSIFDHNKNPRDIDYIVKDSDCLSIIHLKNIWCNENKMGISWQLFQTKIFKPIQKLDECIIYDEYEDHPLRHYFNVAEPKIIKKTIVDNKNKETDPIFGKYVKLKRIGVNENIINMKLKQDGLSIIDFNNFMNNIKVTSTVKVPASNNKITPMMFKGIKLKKTNPIKKMKSVSNNQCVVTAEELSKVIKNLRPNNKSF
tara:strand:- start:30 stop:1013 length:984 start_codon:yes stop_codon:yes gene_type:complete